MSKRGKWLYTGGIGASLFGFGLCSVVECAFLKHNGAEWWHWVGLGTISLGVVIFGLVLLIKAGVMEKDLK